MKYITKLIDKPLHFMQFVGKMAINYINSVYTFIQFAY